MKRSALLRQAIGLLSIVAVLVAQSAAAACVCAFMQMGMPGPCATGVVNSTMPPARVAPTAPGTMAAMQAHGMERGMGSACVCPGHDASRGTAGEASHPALTHAVAATPRYIVADVQALPAWRAFLIATATPIHATPPPHSILHCVFLI